MLLKVWFLKHVFKTGQVFINFKGVFTYIIYLKKKLHIFVKPQLTKNRLRVRNLPNCFISSNFNFLKIKTLPIQTSQKIPWRYKKMRKWNNGGKCI